MYLQSKRSRFSPLVRKIPWRREWQQTPTFLPGEFCAQRSVTAYSPWGCKELDTAEQLTHNRHSNSLKTINLTKCYYSHHTTKDTKAQERNYLMIHELYMEPPGFKLKSVWKIYALSTALCCLSWKVSTSWANITPRFLFFFVSLSSKTVL